MSTSMIGTLAAIRNTFIVLAGPTHIMAGPTHIMLPPGMEVEWLVVGERVMVTATKSHGQWIAESIESYSG